MLTTLEQLGKLRQNYLHSNERFLQEAAPYLDYLAEVSQQQPDLEMSHSKDSFRDLTYIFKVSELVDFFRDLTAGDKFKPEGFVMIAKAYDGREIDPAKRAPVPGKNLDVAITKGMFSSDGKLVDTYGKQSYAPKSMDHVLIVDFLKLQSEHYLRLMVGCEDSNKLRSMGNYVACIEQINDVLERTQLVHHASQFWRANNYAEEERIYQSGNDKRREDFLATPIREVRTFAEEVIARPRTESFSRGNSAAS